MGGEKTGFSPRSVPAAHVLSRGSPPPPVQAGPRGLLCPAGWSLPVPPAFAQEVSSHPWQVFLPRAPAAHGLACGQPQNKCSWGGSTPVMPPPDFSWPLTFGWLGQTLFSLPGCCMRSSDTLSSMPNLLVTPGLHVCPVPSGSGTALCREQADAGRWDRWPLLARVLVATLHPGVPLRPLLLPPGVAPTFSVLAWEGGRGVHDGGQPGGATRQPAKA